MRRRRQSNQPENHERWLVSYADFITLMFAFFVMMYANSKTDQARAQQISEAFREALSNGAITQALSRLVGVEKAAPKQVASAAAAASKTPELAPSLLHLNESLKAEIAAGRLEVRLEQRGLVISLKEAAFFPSGNDTIDTSTLPTIGKIATELHKTPNPIRMEGHTDSVPISNGRFRSNWDLSAARAIAMLNLFAERFSIPAVRMAVAGFAETAPVASNETLEGRARNRRVDIVVLNEMAARGEPRQSASRSR